MPLTVGADVAAQTLTFTDYGQGAGGYYSNSVTCNYGADGGFLSCSAGGVLPGGPIWARSVDFSSWYSGSAVIRWTANDRNPCTADACTGGVPTHTNASDETSCDSGSRCALATCAAGVCVSQGSVPVDDGIACTADSCSEATGVVHDSSGCSKPPQAPAIDETKPYDFAAATSFLWGTGMDAKRAAVVRGFVRDDVTGQPLYGANVTILGHTESTPVTTRADGWYDIAVNGGGDVVVQVSATGRLPVQRTVETRWHDFTVAPDIRLIAPADPSDPVVANAGSWQYARGPLVTEAGQPTRQQVLIFQPGTSVTAIGSGQSFKVRMTEYTVGPNGVGPERMPGTLPPTSLYTYAVELGLEDMQGTPVASPTFDKDVYAYVQDVMGTALPKGWRVPSGWYDRDKGVWMPAEWAGATDGCVVAFGGVTNGKANLDSGGCNIAFSDGEREAFANAYPSVQGPKNFWRVPLRHFSPQDFNWGGGPNDAVPPLGNGPSTVGARPETTVKNGTRCNTAGSIIECSNQGLAEEIPIRGTPYVLRHQNDMTAAAGTTIFVPVTGDNANLPTSLKRIDLEIQVAGQRIRQSVPKLGAAWPKNHIVEVHWNHLDGMGNFVQGFWDAVVDLRYVYEAKASNGPTVNGSSFGMVGLADGANVQGVDRENRELFWSRRWLVRVGGFDAKQMFDMGGWHLTAEHVYDPRSGTLVGGDGSLGSALERANIMGTVVGGKVVGGGEPAAGMNAANVHFGSTLGGLAVAPSGRIYFGYQGQIWSVDPVTRLLTWEAGVLHSGTSGSTFTDGADAQNVFIYPYALVVAPDESLYVAEGNTYRVIRISKRDPQDSVPRRAYRIAGQAGTQDVVGGTGDGGQATSALLGSVFALARASDGTLFVADTGSYRIRQITAAGIISTVAGTGTAGNANLNGLQDARAVNLGSVQGIVWTPSGDVLFSNSSGAISQLMPSGLLRTFAGIAGQSTDGPDGVLATTTTISQPQQLARAQDGRVYLRAAAANEHVVRYVGTDGIMQSLVRGLAHADGEAAMNTDAGEWGALAAHPNGCLLMVDQGSYSVQGGTTGYRIRQVCPVAAPSGSEYLIPREDGSEVYRFDLAGRHLATVTALRGRNRVLFEPDGQGQRYVSDGNPLNRVHIVRSSTAVTFTAPGGQVTTIDLNANTGFATRITLPDATQYQPPSSNHYDVVHDPSTGLLTQLTDPRGHVHSFQYEVDALLKKDKGPPPGSAPTDGTKLERTVDMWGRTVERTSPEYRTWKYSFTSKPTNTGRQSLFTVIDPAGLSTEKERFWSDKVQGRGPDLGGTNGREWSAETALVSDPRWLALAPLAGSSTFTTKGNLGTGFQSGDLERTVSTQELATTTGGDPFALSGTTAIQRTVTVSASGVDPKSWTQKFDATASTWTMTTPAGRTHSAVLDALDRPQTLHTGNTASQSPIADVTLAYDGRGRISAISQGAGGNARTYSLGYDAAGWLQYVRDPLYSASYPDLHQVTFARNAQTGRPSSIGLLRESSARNLALPSYDPLGNPAELKTPQFPSNAHSMTWTPVNLLSSYQPPLQGATTYDYDRERNPTVEANPVETMTYQYDAAGRLLLRSHAAAVTTYGYAASTGQLVSVSDSSNLGVLGVGFDYGGAAAMQPPLGAPLTRIRYAGLTQSIGNQCGPAQHCIEYSYDGLGRKVARRIDGGKDVTFLYDDDGLLWKVSVAGKTLELFHGTQNPLYTGSNIDGVIDAVTYNEFGEPSRVDVGPSGSCLKIEYEPDSQHLRDKVGRIVQKKVSGQIGETWNYQYDGRGFLKSAKIGTSEQIAGTYDEDGNRLDRQYAEDDRIAGGGGWTNWFYNGNGDLTGIGQGASPDYTWTWDPLGNLRAAWGAGGARNMTYGIDGLNRRVIVKKAGVVVAQYLWDEHDRLVARLDATGAVIQQYVYATRSNSPDLLVDYTAGTKVYRYVHDQVGTIMMVLETGSACNVAQKIQYTALGYPHTVQGAQVNVDWQPFGFAGGLYDKETTQLRFGARDYDAWSGRWFTKDRSRFNGGLNLYGYCENDPVNCIDPAGLRPMVDKYASRWDAAMDALQNLLTAPPGTVEYSGLIFENGDGTYSYTMPLAGLDHRGNTQRTGPLAMVQCDGRKIVGSYHNHPSGTNFSHVHGPGGIEVYPDHMAGDIAGARLGHAAFGDWASYIVMPDGRFGAYYPARDLAVYGSGLSAHGGEL